MEEIEIDLRFARVTRFQNRMVIEADGVRITLVGDSPFIMRDGEEQLRLF